VTTGKGEGAAASGNGETDGGSYAPSDDPQQRAFDHQNGYSKMQPSICN
jgi:hypothetical protein